MRHRTMRLAARIGLALVIFAFLAAAIFSRPEKRMTDFDQSFYITIAHDLVRHGVFSNGVFDRTDSTREAPPPGMFFGPLYPALVAAAMQASSGFSQAVLCHIEANEMKSSAAHCPIDARPILLLHAALLTIAALAIGLAAEILFVRFLLFPMAAAFAAAGFAMESELFSFIMTESTVIALYSLTALFLVLAWKTERARYALLCGASLGLLCLARPSYLVLAPVILLLSFVQIGWLRAQRRKALVSLLALAGAFALLVGPWYLRNAVVLGKFAMTEEYGAATVIERFAFNDMTAREFGLAFPYCLPAIGPRLVAGIAGTGAMARFEWDAKGSFFETGRARRMALVEQHGKLDPVIGDIIRDELSRNAMGYVLSAIPLAWCGLWVAQIWSLLFIPAFAVALVLAWRRRLWPFLLYSTPPFVMLALHAAVANHYPRYNLILIGPASAGAAWLIALWLARARRSRSPSAAPAS